MHRALRSDDSQLLHLLVAEARRQAQLELELRGAAALGRRVFTRHLDVSALPTLVLRVHLHRDRGARREACGEELLRARSLVVAAFVLGLVSEQVMSADVD